MPKKFQVTNQKSEAARERKAEVAANKKKAEEAKKTDDLWQEDDKHIAAKQRRKDDSASKAQEKAAKRAELKRLEQEEEKELSAMKGHQANTKVTRAQVAERIFQATDERLKQQALKEKKSTQQDIVLENPNIVLQEEQVAAEADGKEFVSGTGIDEAVAAASGLAKDKETGDLHPERRAKAAFKAYEEEWMPKLRKESPSLKLSQLKERLWKQWQKSPDNPYNATKL